MINEDPIEIKRLPEDRSRGEGVEEKFCSLMQEHSCFTYRFQKGYPKAAVLEKGDEFILLPDCWVLGSNAPFLAEVKWKYPNKYNCYGLEEYRVKSLLRVAQLTLMPVFYVILDSEEGIWYWNDFFKLMEKRPRIYLGESYVAGSVQKVPIVYFQKEWFIEVIKNGKLNFPA